MLKIKWGEPKKGINPKSEGDVKYREHFLKPVFFHCCEIHSHTNLRIQNSKCLLNKR